MANNERDLAAITLAVVIGDNASTTVLASAPIFAAGNFLVLHGKGKCIAVLDDGGPYGQDLAEATLKTLHKHGLRESFFARATPGAPNDLPVIRALTDATVMCGDTLSDSTFNDYVGKDADGVIFLSRL